MDTGKYQKKTTKTHTAPFRTGHCIDTKLIQKGEGNHLSDDE